MLLVCCGVSGIASRPVCAKMVSDKAVLSVPFIWSLDGLLLQLRNSGIGCHIGNFFVGALAYADDQALLPHSASAMRTRLKICDDYAKQLSIVFNAAKSTCLLVTSLLGQSNLTQAASPPRTNRLNVCSRNTFRSNSFNIKPFAHY